jgi:tail sheath protein
MTALVVPGVRVEARFDVLPPLPAPSGIIGAVGIVDRMPNSDQLVGVTKISELRDIFGPGIESSMPEAAHALANGASEVVVSPVSGGAPATITLKSKNSIDAVMLRCRSNGKWGNSLSAEVRETLAAGKVVRVSIRLYLGKTLVESFDNLQPADPTVPGFLFDTINARSRYVIALDPALGGADTPLKLNEFTQQAVPASGLEIKSKTKSVFFIDPATGVDPTGLTITIPKDAPTNKIDIDVFKDGLQEQYRGLTLDADDPNYLPDVLVTQSRLIRARSSAPSPDKPEDEFPTAITPTAFSNGTSPAVADYFTAIAKLENDPRIDLVFASIEPTRTAAEVQQIHQSLLAHAVKMADVGAPRIAFGSVRPDDQKNLGAIGDHLAVVRNRRFVLVSPSGAEGAVAGMVGRMDVQDAPTFKNVPLFGIAPARYSESELNRLLGPAFNLLVVQQRAGHGVIVLKGIDTTGDQISVTRVADDAIRETKAIAENFIGQLNTEDARVALKQQIVSTFIRMERDGAIVPSTDGKDPSFVVDVYSTQLDFAQGIVRIDIAVRPVRSIDYIYATIRVKN